MISPKVASELKSVIDQLRTERSQIDEKIQLLEKALGGLGVKRRGRPPGSGSTSASASGAVKKVTRNWSPAARKAAAERMRKYWAERRRGK